LLTVRTATCVDLFITFVFSFRCCGVHDRKPAENDYVIVFNKNFYVTPVQMLQDSPQDGARIPVTDYGFGLFGPQAQIVLTAANPGGALRSAYSSQQLSTRNEVPAPRSVLLSAG
jgi:hypothetical protein